MTRRICVTLFSMDIDGAHSLPLQIRHTTALPYLQQVNKTERFLKSDSMRMLICSLSHANVAISAVNRGAAIRDERLSALNEASNLTIATNCTTWVIESAKILRENEAILHRGQELQTSKDFAIVHNFNHFLVFDLRICGLPLTLVFFHISLHFSLRQLSHSDA